MSDYAQVKERARKLGALGDSSLPIAIVPTTSYHVTRVIIVPVKKASGDKVHGQYMKHPAIITVEAFNAGEASARADEVQYNTQMQLWGSNSGSRPWSGGGSWREVELPGDTQPMALR